MNWSRLINWKNPTLRANIPTWLLYSKWKEQHVRINIIFKAVYPKHPNDLLFLKCASERQFISYEATGEDLWMTVKQHHMTELHDNDSIKNVCPDFIHTMHSYTTVYWTYFNAIQMQPIRMLHSMAESSWQPNFHSLLLCRKSVRNVHFVFHGWKRTRWMSE